MLPSVVGGIHPRFHTPATASGIYACVGAALAISSSFTQLAILANVAALTLYLMCVAAAFDLQRRDVRADGAIPFAVPGGPIVPVLAGAAIIWLLTSATRREFGVEALVLAVATVFYFIRKTGGQI